MTNDVFIHEKALVESDQIGSGTRIWAFAHVMPEVNIGEKCNIGGHAFIETGAVLGDRVTVKNGVQIWDRVIIEDDVFLGPNMIFTNDINPRAAFKKDPREFLPTFVRQHASLGANCTIVCGVTIGYAAFVGAGAVVIRDIPDYALVVGNPSRIIGYMCPCGEKISEELECKGCQKKYFKEDGVVKEVTPSREDEWPNGKIGLYNRS